mmetsp:Transcript_53294/g.165298  ORF Transcript_53294/g.165298 Transcript_53294/m.165298 type:complete len:228 (+) Transcript_53294:1101-1784(+)
MHAQPAPCLAGSAGCAAPGTPRGAGADAAGLAAWADGCHAAAAGHAAWDDGGHEAAGRAVRVHPVADGHVAGADGHAAAVHPRRGLSCSTGLDSGAGGCPAAAVPVGAGAGALGEQGHPLLQHRQLPHRHPARHPEGGLPEGALAARAGRDGVDEGQVEPRRTDCAAAGAHPVSQPRPAHADGRRRAARRLGPVLRHAALAAGAARGLHGAAGQAGSSCKGLQGSCA